MTVTRMVVKLKACVRLRTTGSF